MHGVLVAEILIEFTIPALIIMGAGSKINPSLHVVHTGLFPGWQLSQTVFPEYNFTSAARRRLTQLPRTPVFARSTLQGPIESAGFAMIVCSTIPAPNHPGLLPEAGGVRFGIHMFRAFGIHGISLQVNVNCIGLKALGVQRLN
jgi:hypothetical protein